MLELKFKINKIYLYAQIIKHAKFLGKQDKILEIRLWEKSKIAYSIISGVYYNRIAPKTALESSTIKKFSKNLSKNIKLTERILGKELNSKEFRKIYQETEDYKIKAEKQWRQNKKQALKHLRDITGLKLPNTALSVCLVHPALCDGRYWRNINIITWGHSEDWQNYTTVYLCHEIMHFLTKDYVGDKKILHALIELACDNELRIRLNQDGKYFKEGRFRVGHKSLQKIEKQILSQWRQYLQSREKNKENFFTFFKKMDNKK
ncbi:hypothetical protein B6D52_03185 [Candidatus Parcubacteria bacterium 4484_255]|nr:MAG: hypothetical protein B6D52_03185 [Candidatus Parcubacteria bacterium 4484_255]